MDPKVKALIAKANKKYGEETIILGGRLKPVPRLPSGSLGLDLVLGGGWPLNQWNEIIGNESAGKTVLALKTIAHNQKIDPEWTAVWVAAEEYVPDWAKALGVDNDRVIVINEQGMEKAFQHVLEFAETKAIDGIVVDSLPALVPERALEGTMDDFAPGLVAIRTGQFFGKVRPATRRSLLHDERPIMGLMINQWREKIGVIHGDPRSTPGGKAKNFAFFTRIEARRNDWIKDGEDKVGQEIKIVSMKNKSHPPQKTAVVDFYFDDHEDFTAGDYDLTKETINLGILFSVIERKGSWYVFEGEQWQGRASLVEGLRGNPTLMAKVQYAVLGIAKGGHTLPEVFEEEARIDAAKTRKKVRRSA